MLAYRNVVLGVVAALVCHGGVCVGIYKYIFRCFVISEVISRHSDTGGERAKGRNVNI